MLERLSSATIPGPAITSSFSPAGRLWRLSFDQNPHLSDRAPLCMTELDRAESVSRRGRTWPSGPQRHRC